jgi:prepilin peptidase CpaA
MTFPAVLLGSVMGFALVTDLRTRKIPNRLILAGLALALGWQFAGPEGNWTFDAASPGAVGPLGGLVAFFVMLIAFLPLYALRVMGAGDVKLLAVVAAFFGASTSAWAHLIGLALCVLVAGGVLAVLRMAIAGTGAAAISNLRKLIVGHSARLAGLPAPVFDPQTDSADRMPYAIAIAAGTVLYVGAKWSGWLKFL